jgi:predicted XRE-type DNA-binding protein
MSEDRVITRSSGNVFADAGLPDADTHLVKAELVRRLDEIIRERGLSQREAARVLGVAQPDLSQHSARPLPGLLGRAQRDLCARPRARQCLRAVAAAFP